MSEKKILLIKNDIIANNNKWYKLELSGNQVVATYGRVGDQGQKKIYSGGEYIFNKKYSEKLAKGYVETKTVDSSTSISTNLNLLQVAKEQIKTNGNSIVENLIERLVSENIHNICSVTSITYNRDSNLFSTPLGIITLDAVKEARGILNNIYKIYEAKNLADYNVRKLSENYLKLIPTNFGRQRFNPETFFTQSGFEKQTSILDALEVSFTSFHKTPVQNESKIIEKVFDLSLNIASEQESNILRNWFNKTNHSTHGYKNLKIENIYRIECFYLSNRFNKKLGNIIEILHGTSGSNCLSILKNGIKASPPSTAQITGRMWGGGTYGALDFSKSLQYTMGRFGGKCSGKGWIFVCDFAMGKIEFPKTYGGKRSFGYDSIWAKASNTGLRFDELIVPTDEQVNLKYLLEFT